MVYAEEVVWHPKTQPDPQYHYDGILSALRAAAAICRGWMPSAYPPPV